MAAMTPKVRLMSKLVTSTNSPAPASFSAFAEELVGAAAEDEKLSPDEGKVEEKGSEGSEDCKAMKDCEVMGDCESMEVWVGLLVSEAVPYAAAALQ
jgi:hypothetical protein